MQGVMRKRDWIAVSGICALVLVTILGLVLTRNSTSLAVQTRPRRAPLVDEQPVQTARSMMALATSREEQRFAQQALRLADHAVDLAFADAIREATLRPLADTPATKELFARVSRAEAQVKSDQDMIDDLKKESAPGHAADQAIEQQLALLQAQLELDKDELENAKSDLLRSGADPLSRVRRQFARYQAAQQENDAARQIALPGPEGSLPERNLIAQCRAWRAKRAKAIQLQRARAEAVQKHDQLQQKHDSPEQPTPTDSGQLPQPSSSAGGGSQDQVVMAFLHSYSERQKSLADLNKRIQDHQDLADVYAGWAGLVQLQQEEALHGVIRSVLLILLIVLIAYLLDRAIASFFARLVPDARRLRTLRVVLRFALEAVGLLLILLVLFGTPSQMPTILGLAGAGLTVALKDFIVAFFGWFALMGRNGIRVGDWVEIKGVVGEVTKIGLLRTVLLETGNWNDPGHPTGRKVAFVNSFAIEGHYFNFSTSGQWLWDELQFLVPAGRNPYPIIEAIQKLVTAATEANARKAEEEWQHSSQRERMPAVSATPAINLRPTTSGVEVHIRYITRAHERYATRTRLYQEIVALLHHSESEPRIAGHPVAAGT